MTKRILSRNRLLPGVKRSRPAPANRAGQFHNEVSQARARANRKDFIDVLLLLLVDLLFVSWERATVPFLSRDVTVSLLLMLHFGFAASVFAHRILPGLRARFLASTWSTPERRRLRA